MPATLERGRRRGRSSSIARDDTDEAAQRLIANIVASSDDEMNGMKDNLANDNDDQSFSSSELNVFDNVATNKCAVGPFRKAVVPRPNKNRKSSSVNAVINVNVKLSRDQLSSDIESAGHILDVNELEALKAQRLAHQNNNENNSEDEQSNSRRVRRKAVVRDEESDEDFHVFDDDSSSEEESETPWKKTYKSNKTNEIKNDGKNNTTTDNKVNAIPKKRKNESNVIDHSATKEVQPSIRKQANKSPSPESSTKKSISLIANMAPQQSTMGASWAHPSATQRSNPTSTLSSTSSNTAQETTSQNIQEISQQIQTQDNQITKDPKIVSTDIEEQVRDDIDDLLRRILSSSKEKGKEPSDSFIPNTTSEQYDFFERDSSGAIIHSPPIPMFPEDFTHGRKEWPLSWWGILKPPDDLLAVHEHYSKGNNGQAGNNNMNNNNRYGNSGGGNREWERNTMNNSYRGNYGNDPMMMAGGGPAYFNNNRPPPQQQRFPQPMHGNHPPNGSGGGGPWFGHYNMQGGGDWPNQRMPDRGGWREDGSAPGRGLGPGDRQHPQGFGSHQGHGIPFDRPRRPMD